ncbi:MAG: GtrA family protein [Methylococcales bacterium]|nr:GtrA family protein [Methylococcales bacterium]
MKIVRSFMRYLLTGGVAYGVDVLLFAALHLLLQLPVTHANVLARVAGAVTAYGINHVWTFKHPVALIKHSSIRYFSLWLINTALSTALLQTLSRQTAIPLSAINIKASIELMLVLTNFFICKYWVFKKS